MLILSIIGVDQFDAGFSAGVNAHEAVALAGSIPTDIVRASQFREFVGQLLDWCTQGEAAYVPKMRTQPVGARALAEAIAAWSTSRRQAGRGSRSPARRRSCCPTSPGS